MKCFVYVRIWELRGTPDHYCSFVFPAWIETQKENEPKTPRLTHTRTHTHTRFHVQSCCIIAIHKKDASAEATLFQVEQAIIPPFLYKSNAFNGVHKKPHAALVNSARGEETKKDRWNVAPHFQIVAFAFELEVDVSAFESWLVGSP